MPTFHTHARSFYPLNIFLSPTLFPHILPTLAVGTPEGFKKLGEAKAQVRKRVRRKVKIWVQE